MVGRCIPSFITFRFLSLSTVSSNGLIRSLYEVTIGASTGAASLFPRVFFLTTVRDGGVLVTTFFLLLTISFRDKTRVEGK
ncbi:hypothetical protein CARUB_v10021236mg [Capsella rubella]|uniref:Uncharacterized protein n=1 Tax=Capsella rubella TaxID=81985 RepID=R0IGN0_9BRAS|nr:hypothetical protein CARUB_v10021236mg [Capsella rubella]